MANWLKVTSWHWAILLLVPTVGSCADAPKALLGTAKEILQAMDEARNITVADDSPAARTKAFETAFRTILAGADKVMTLPDATEEDKVNAMEYKISVLFQGAQLKLPNYSQQLATLKDQLVQADPKSKQAELASFLWVRQQHEGEEGLSVKALPAIEKLLQTFPQSKLAFSFLDEIAQIGEQTDDAESAKKAYQTIIKHFKDDPRAARMEGVLRRLELLGKPMKIAGTTLQGEKLDVANLKGKVILIDFWATWCGPCVGEIPNMKALYQKYHDAGFEIVGVPLDQKPEDLQNFLTESKVPWQQLDFFAEMKKSNGHPLADYYGINGIPAMFLIDRQGNVVSTNARGRILEDLLANLFKTPAADK